MLIIAQKIECIHWINLFGLKTLLVNHWELMKYSHVLLIIPNSSLFPSNCSLISALVKISAICLSVAQKFIEIKPFSTLSLKKWWRTSTCLVLLCWHRFLAMLIALVLSQNRGMHPVSTPKSLSYCRIHSSWAQQEAAATYSTLAVDMETKCYFFVDEETKQGPRKVAIPDVLFLSTRNPA